MLRLSLLNNGCSSFVKKTLYCIVGITAILVLTQCQKPQQKVFKDPNKIHVVVTTTMLQSLVKAIGGDKVEVYGVMKPKEDPHTYQHVLADLNAIKSANIIIYSGLHLEIKLQEILEKKAAKNPHIIAVGDSIPKDKLIKPNGEKYADPHFWGDPDLWKIVVKKVAAVLKNYDKKNAEYFQQRESEYLQQLAVETAWAKKMTASIPAMQRIMITSHDAFAYYARAFQLQSKGIQGLSTSETTSVAEIKKLCEFIKNNKIKTLFTETSVNSRDVEIITKETGAKVAKNSLYSDSVDKPNTWKLIDGKKVDLGTYLGSLRYNTDVIVNGLR